MHLRAVQEFWKRRTLAARLKALTDQQLAEVKAGVIEKKKQWYRVSEAVYREETARVKARKGA